MARDYEPLEHKCAYFPAATSDCLRSGEHLLRSIERGLLDLCGLHYVAQKRRDTKMLEETADEILSEFHKVGMWKGVVY